MLVDLIDKDFQKDSGLQAYYPQYDGGDGLRRRAPRPADLPGGAGRVYSAGLATAVTEALHYFIGHDQPSPQDRVTLPGRYRRPHRAHAARYAPKTVAAGYYNIPGEYLQAHHGISARKTWKAPPTGRGCSGRVQLARELFRRRPALPGASREPALPPGWLRLYRPLPGRAGGHRGRRLPAAARIIPSADAPGTALRMGWSALSLALSVRPPPAVAPHPPRSVAPAGTP